LHGASAIVAAGASLLVDDIPFRAEDEDLRGEIGVEVNLGHVGDHAPASVDFVEPERRITDVLNAIDQWLPTAGLPLVKLHLDGSSYTLSAPAATTTDAA
jgi:hypothetical protein